MNKIFAKLVVPGKDKYIKLCWMGLREGKSWLSVMPLWNMKLALKSIKMNSQFLPEEVLEESAFLTFMACFAPVHKK